MNPVNATDSQQLCFLLALLLLSFAPLNLVRASNGTWSSPDDTIVGECEDPESPAVNTTCCPDAYPFWGYPRTRDEYCAGITILFEAASTNSAAPVFSNTVDYVYDQGGCGSDISEGSPCAELLPGVGRATVCGIDVRINLGRARDTGSAGFLWVHSPKKDGKVFTPAGLRIVSDSDIESLTVVSNDVLRQVMTPEALVDIIPTSSNSYEMSFYHPVDLPGTTDENGYYLLPLGEGPFAKHTIKNPSPGTNDVSKFEWIQVFDGSSAKSVEFENTAEGTNTAWVLRYDNGLREEHSYSVSNGTSWIQTLTVKDGDGNEITKVEKTWGQFPWGQNLVKEVTDPGGANLTMSKTFHTNPDLTNSYGQVKSISFKDGSWARYEYDGANRLTNEVRSWLDEPITAEPSDAVVIEYDYFTNDSTMDVPTGGHTTNANGKVIGMLPYAFTKPRTTTTKVKGIEAETRFYTYQGEFAEVTERATNQLSFYGSSNNLRTKREYFDLIALGIKKRQLKRVEWPDGRLDKYLYTEGNYNESTSEFTSSSGGDYIRKTLTHATIDDPSGIANRTTKETTIYDAVLLPVYTEVELYTGSGYQSISWEKITRDKLRRVTKIERSDGTEKTITWECCGMSSVVDFNGIKKTFEYDDLNRLVTNTKKGVSGGNDILSKFTYDAAGRILTETNSASSLTRKKSSEYDGADRITAFTDLTGLTTSYDYEEDGRKTTITLPGGATQITVKHMDGRTKSVTGTALTTVTNVYGINSDGTQYRIKYTGTNNAARNWVKTTTDMIARVVKVESLGFDDVVYVEETEYDDEGRVNVIKRTNEPDTLFLYDSLSKVLRSVRDVNDNGVINLDGPDRIDQFNEIYSSPYFKLITRVFANNGSSDFTDTGNKRTRVTGHEALGIISEVRETDIHGEEIVTTTVLDRANKKKTVSTDLPHSNSNLVSVTVNGLLVATYDTSGNKVRYEYDALGRQIKRIDPRTGTETTTYNATHGRVETIVDADSNTNKFIYYTTTGLLKQVTDPLGDNTYYEYDDRENIIRTWGSGTYPVEYLYDEFNRTTNMITYQSGSNWDGAVWPSSTGPGDTTTWGYDDATGLLIEEEDAAGESVTFTYTTDGKIKKRTWARTELSNPLTTTYTYNDIGELELVDYSGTTTEDISFTYDRLGRQKSVTDAVGTREFTYNDVLQLDDESISTNAPHFYRLWYTLTQKYEGAGAGEVQGRSAGFALDGYDATYAYDSFGRLDTVDWAVKGSVGTSTYSYLKDSNLLKQRAFSGGITTDYSYESNRDLLSQIKHSTGLATISQYDYKSDGAGRRTSVVNSGSAFDSVGPAFNAYTYNGYGEVTSAIRYWGTDTNVTSNPVEGQSFLYAYDNIGNRTHTTNNGQEAIYSPNSLNQYTSRDIPGAIEVIGSAIAEATVTVNGQTSARNQAYFRKQLTVDNSSAALYEAITVDASDANVSASLTGLVFVAKDDELFFYDDDGNLLEDGRWDYTWNAENRLIAAETRSELTSLVPHIRVEFFYDYLGRRVKKSFLTDYNGTVWTKTNNTYFVFDGWHVVSEIFEKGTAVTTNSYVWGLDRSSTIHGSAGIGGLLAKVSDVGSTTFYSHDAQGNIAQVVDSTDNIVAHYEYDTYGDVIVQTGPESSKNPFRFSTKYHDNETELVYYGYRHYNASTGRWLSRDPSGIAGGLNLYLAFNNDPINFVDPDGLNPNGSQGSGGTANAPQSSGTCYNGGQQCNSSGGTATSSGGDDPDSDEITTPPTPEETFPEGEGGDPHNVDLEKNQPGYDEDANPGTAEEGPALEGNDSNSNPPVDGDGEQTSDTQGDSIQDGPGSSTHAMSPKTGGRLHLDDTITAEELDKLRKSLKDPKVSAKEKSQIRRRIKENERTKSKRAHGKDIQNKMVATGEFIAGGVVSAVGLLATGVLIADDVTGIGVANDPLIPFTAGITAAGGALMADAVLRWNK